MVLNILTWENDEGFSPDYDNYEEPDIPDDD